MQDYGWLVIRSEPNREATGAAALTGWGIDAYLPKIRVEQRPRRGVKRSVLLPMFRGYLFAWCCPSDPLWARLWTAAGLRGPLQLGGTLAIITQAGIDFVRAKESELINFKAPTGPKYKSGDTVRLNDGSAFTGQLCNIEDVDSDQRIVILLNLFGRVVRTKVSSNQIERV